jgi:chemotaxis protein CheC
MEWVLNELEKDLFREIANIGLSKAADALAILSKEKVLLSVPDIQLVNPTNLLDIVSGDKSNTIVIKSAIKGEIEGQTVLLFSQAHVEKFIKDSVNDIAEFQDQLEKLRDSLLLEISNIITGSIVTQFSNIFQLNMYGSVPTGPSYNVVDSINQLLKEFPSFQPLIFSIKTKFVNSGRLLDLPMLIVFDTDTLLKLLSIVRSNNVKNINFLSQS